MKTFMEFWIQLLLKQKGLTKPDLDKFFEGLLETIISTAFKLIL